MEMIFASGNLNKVSEISEMLGKGYLVLSLREVGVTEEIPETADTLEGNALLKARYLYERLGKAVFAEDTGLEIDALEGNPGVYTARFAGPQKDSEANMALVLKKLEGREDRGAQFRTVLAYIDDEGREYTFEGICRGYITLEKSGDQGFGYDPIFRPEGYDQTFAQMDAKGKNRISHRGRALQKFVEFVSA